MPPCLGVWPPKCCLLRPVPPAEYRLRVWVAGIECEAQIVKPLPRTGFADPMVFLGAVSAERTQAEFLARDEQAWQEYQRMGQSRPASEVLDRLQERIDARRQELAKPRWPRGDGPALAGHRNLLISLRALLTKASMAPRQFDGIGLPPHGN